MLISYSNSSTVSLHRIPTPYPYTVSLYRIPTPYPYTVSLHRIPIPYPIPYPCTVSLYRIPLFFLHQTPTCSPAPSLARFLYNNLIQTLRTAEPNTYRKSWCRKTPPLTAVADAVASDAVAFTSAPWGPLFDFVCCSFASITPGVLWWSQKQQVEQRRL